MVDEGESSGIAAAAQARMQRGSRDFAIRGCASALAASRRAVIRV